MKAIQLQCVRCVYTEWFLWSGCIAEPKFTYSILYGPGSLWARYVCYFQWKVPGETTQVELTEILKTHIPKYQSAEDRNRILIWFLFTPCDK